MAISQTRKKEQADKQLKRIAENANTIIETLEWYDSQLRKFKEIVPGYNSAHKLEGYINAWKNIVPECDTPEKLAAYIKSLEHGEIPQTEEISHKSLYEQWNQVYVPYCKQKDILKYPFSSEEEYLEEQNDFLNDLKMYNRAIDPLGFRDFFMWLKERDIILPAEIEVLL